MFVFDAAFRPVPLGQTLVGIRGKAGGMQSRDRMNKYAYDTVIKVLEQGRQAMIFVHSRKDTVKTGLAMVDLAQQEEQLGLLEADEGVKATREYNQAFMEMAKSRNKELKLLFARSIGIHHAGMLRSDRLMVERLFTAGHIKVLVCTATLAWGVNLPAYACIIKGT